MNSPLPTRVDLRRPKGLVPDSVKLSPALRSFIEQDLLGYLKDHVRVLEETFQKIHDQINSSVQSVGSDLPSATTITPTNPIHVVTGSAEITTITVPRGFSGPVFLVPGGAWTMAAGGNIATATAAVLNKVMTVVYSYRSELWYPSY